jgi:hypothetical protein
MAATERPSWHSTGEAIAARMLRAALCQTPTAGGAAGRPEFTPDDWARLVEFACPGGLAGLVLASAKKLNLTVPSEELERLRSAAAQVGAHHLHIQAKLEPVLEAFDRAGVELLALKGLVLSRQVYGRCDLRPMSDVDLMLRPADAERGCRILEESGCRRGEEMIRADFFPRFYYEVEYYTPGPCPVRLDVHARPFRPVRYRRTVPDDGLWDESERVAVGRGHVRVPSAERMLIHLCCHAACHGAKRLLWLLDIKLFADSAADRMDWGLFVRLVAQWRLGWPVRRALDRVAAVFGEAAPAESREAIGSLRSNWLDRLALWHAPRDADHPVGRLFVDAVTGGGRGDGLAYLAAIAFPQRSHMATLYSRRHLGWLACAHGRRMARVPIRLIRRLMAGSARRGLRSVVKALH